jgi:hypothetical protein
LLENWTRQFNGFKVVKLAFLQEDTEILKDGGKTAGRCWGRLERLDDLDCA